MEQYIMDHANELGYASTNDATGCSLWWGKNSSSSALRYSEHVQIDAKVKEEFLEYRNNLERHTKAVSKFEPIPDLMESIPKTGSHDVCVKARLHPNGLQEFFASD